MSYNVSKEEIQKAIKEVTGRNAMQTCFPTNQWQMLHEKLLNLLSGENGSKFLFLGSNVEHYRQ